MTRDLERLLDEYRGQSLLLDANLLLVLIVGLSDPLLVAKHKKTKGEYNPEDLVLLVDLVHFFASSVTTPHLLTEVSNLLGQSPAGLKKSLFDRFGGVIEAFTEHTIPSKVIAIQNHFAIFGLTDLGILEIASREKCLVVTDDSGFVNYLHQKQIDAFEFRLLRKLNQD